MDQHLPTSGIPCPFLKVGQCPKGDGCAHAHDFMAQPCLSASQIDYRMRCLENARPAGRSEKAKIKKRKEQLRRLGARKLAAPSLIERGIVPSRQAIRHELGRYTVGPPNILPLAARVRAFVEDGEDDGGGWRTVKLGSERRKRKMLARMRRQKTPRARATARNLGANGNPPAEEDIGVNEDAPGIGSPPAGGASSDYTTTRGSMDVDVELEISRRVEIIGDFTVKYPTSVPLHLQHRYSNASPADMDSPPPQNQPPYTDEGIIYAPPGEVVEGITKEYVIRRGRASSF